MYRLLGDAPHLDWILQRLQSSGLLAERCAPAAGWPLADACGVQCDEGWLDMAQDGWDALDQRVAALSGMAVVEVSGWWLPQGGAQGFMLLTGGPLPLPAQARALLDACAPAQNAWLHCGPLGSARFTRYVMDALLSGWRTVSPEQAAPSALQWESRLQAQWELLDKLRQLAQAYLARQHLAAPDPASLPAALREPATRDGHFAAQLAGLVVLMAQESAQAKPLLEQLLAHWPAQTGAQ